jgi:hypothetical protein
MSNTMRNADRCDADGWVTVAHHDFGGAAELDAAIADALDEQRPDRPLYDTVDIEPAERFLASVGDANASVVFRVADRAIRVTADGRVQLRAASAE